MSEKNVKLLYLWIRDYKKIKNIGFNFTKKFSLMMILNQEG